MSIEGIPKFCKTGIYDHLWLHFYLTHSLPTPHSRTPSIIMIVMMIIIIIMPFIITLGLLEINHNTTEHAQTGAHTHTHAQASLATAVTPERVAMGWGMVRKVGRAHPPSTTDALVVHID